MLLSPASINKVQKKEIGNFLGYATTSVFYRKNFPQSLYIRPSLYMTVPSFQKCSVDYNHKESDDDTNGPDLILESMMWGLIPPWHR